MRAGKLDRTISIERYTPGVPNGYGGVTSVWLPIGTFRAQLVQASTEEFIRAAGASDETVVIFRTRWVANVTTSCRVVYQGKNYDLKEVKEIGRRKGLELRAEARK